MNKKTLELIKAILSTIVADKAQEQLDSFVSITEVDPNVGIYLKPLNDLEPVQHEGQDFYFYIARVMPSKFVNAHKHKIGVEPYHFLSGDNGQLNLGYVQNEAVEWEEPRKVESGDTVVVREGQVHCFVNLGQEPYDFAFACPKAHLIDNSVEKPDGDRYFTSSLESGLPKSVQDKNS